MIVECRFPRPILVNLKIRFLSLLRRRSKRLVVIQLLLSDSFLT